MPSAQCGFAVFFTGLSGAGKSTLAQMLADRLTTDAGRTVTLLDGDEVRTLLSSRLGFTREDRDLNIKRIGYVAREVVRHGGVAICAQIAPFTAARREVRAFVEPQGPFVEVFLATPLEVCEERDPKGLYAKARRGEIAHFTGVSDPYEAPENPECVLDTSGTTPQESLAELWIYLVGQRLLPQPG